MNKFDQISRYSQPQFTPFQITEVLSDEEFAQNLPKDVLEAMKSGDLDKAMEKLKEKARDDEKLSKLMNQWLSEQSHRLIKKMAQPAQMMLSLFKKMLKRLQKKAPAADAKELNLLPKQLKEEQVRKEIIQLNEQKKTVEKKQLLHTLKAAQQTLSSMQAACKAFILTQNRYLTSALQKTKQFLEKSIVSKLFKSATVAQEFLARFKQRQIEPFLKAIKQPFNWAGEKMRQAAERFSQLAQRFGNSVLKEAHSIKNFFRLPAFVKNNPLSSFASRVQAGTQAFGQRAAEAVRSVANTLNPFNYLNPALQRVREAVHHSREAALSGVRAVQQTGANIAQNAAAAAAFVANPVVNLFVQAKQFNVRFIKRGGRGGKQLYQQCKQGVVKAFAQSTRRVRELISSFSAAVVSGLYEMFSLLQKMVLGSLRRLKKELVAFVYAFGRFCLMAMPLIWKGIKALPGLSKRLLHALSQRLRRLVIRGLKKLEQR